MASDNHPHPDRRDEDVDEPLVAPDANDDPRDEAPTPRRTTTGVWTSPKFGSAGSDGAELEPGPERN